VYVAALTANCFVHFVYLAASVHLILCKEILVITAAYFAIVGHFAMVGHFAHPLSILALALSKHLVSNKGSVLLSPVF